MIFVFKKHRDVKEIKCRGCVCVDDPFWMETQLMENHQFHAHGQLENENHCDKHSDKQLHQLKTKPMPGR